MKLEDQLLKRGENKCELCQSAINLKLYEVGPQDRFDEKNSVMLCSKCVAQIDKKEDLDASH